MNSHEHRIEAALTQPLRNPKSIKLYQRLKEIADAEERSLSFVVLRALREWLSAKETRQ